MKIIVSAELDSYPSRAPSGDGWDRGDEEGGVTNVIAFEERRSGCHYYGDSASKELGLPLAASVYAVVADYEDGDTYGSSPHARVLDFFATVEEAADLLAETEKPENQARNSFEYNGESYYQPWNGHFGHLNEIRIWDCQIRQNPADPIRRGSGRYSVKRGN